jgi:energy-coupling factor transporter ATP-binding protein EcfA2
MPDSSSASPTLRAAGLGHRFADGAWAFRGIDFELYSGRIAVLAGRNGAGKTLLAKHLAGLLSPQEGSVHIEGLDIAAMKGSLAARVGYVFQDARLQTVGETVLEDVLFGPTCLGFPDARERAESAIRACGLADKAGLFVHKLSGGELRRLAIAGVLAMRPQAIILDEPFVNLDPDGIRAVLGLVRDMAGWGMAVLIVTHEIEKILGLAGSFAIMDKGAIALTGSPAEVLAAGIESYGLRDPFRPNAAITDLAWL